MKLLALYILIININLIYYALFRSKGVTPVTKVAMLLVMYIPILILCYLVIF